MRKILLLVIIIWFSGCAQNMDSIKRENLELKSKVGILEKQNRELENKLKACSHLNEILTKEKHYSYSELYSLKNDVRAFLRKQIKEIEMLSSKKILMDYRGGEIIKRDFSEEKNVTYILYSKKFNNGDEIRAIKGYFAGPTRFQLKIFRQIDKNYYVCVGETELYSINVQGVKFIPLKNKIILANGDIVGFYFPEISNVFFDKKIGSFGEIKGEVNIGKKIPVKDQQGLSISIGIMGYFQ
ncbi:coiled-coil domain-containing protein [Desulfothermus sp.]